MKLRNVAEALELEVLTGDTGLDREVSGGYCSDLLSDVMAHAKAGDAWITLQTHANVVAVATLTGAATVIVSCGQRPEAATLARAAGEGVAVCASTRPSFELAGQLYALLRPAASAGR